MSIHMNDQLRHECGTAIRALTQWAAGVRLEDIPRPVIARAMRVLADDLAAIVGARDEPEVQCIHARTLRARTSAGGDDLSRRPATDGSTLGSSRQRGRGRLAGARRGLSQHAVPRRVSTSCRRCSRTAKRAALPWARCCARWWWLTRSRPASPGWVPRAFVMQSHGRYCGGRCRPPRSRSPATPSAELLHSALTGAATLTTAAPRDHLVTGALVRNVWPAVGAWSGMMSVEWAECGIGGVDGGFYDVYSTVLGGDAQPTQLTAGLGETWAILDGYMKIFACCQHLHSTVEAVLALRDAVGGGSTFDDIAEITVDTHPLALVARESATGHHARRQVLAAARGGGGARRRRSGGADAFMSVTLQDGDDRAPARSRARRAVCCRCPRRPTIGPRACSMHLADGTTAGRANA